VYADGSTVRLTASEFALHESALLRGQADSLDDVIANIGRVVAEMPEEREQIKAMLHSFGDQLALRSLQLRDESRALLEQSWLFDRRLSLWRRTVEFVFSYCVRHLERLRSRHGT
jgi:hypothetical protein